MYPKSENYFPVFKMKFDILISISNYSKYQLVMSQLEQNKC